MSSISFLRASYFGVETSSSVFTLSIIPGGRIEKNERHVDEQDARAGRDQKPAVVERGVLAEGFWTTALFRLFLFQNEHPGLTWLEIGMFALGVAGFSLWSGLFVPENPLGAVVVLLLALAVLIPLELLLLSFEDLRRSVFGGR